MYKNTELNLWKTFRFPTSIVFSYQSTFSSHFYTTYLLILACLWPQELASLTGNAIETESGSRNDNLSTWQVSAIVSLPSFFFVHSLQFGFLFLHLFLTSSKYWSYWKHTPALYSSSSIARSMCLLSLGLLYCSSPSPSFRYLLLLYGFSL